MLYLFMRKQWKASFFIVILFLLFLLLYNNINNSFSERYVNEQKDYIISQTGQSSNDLIATLDFDLKAARNAVSVIENYEGYDAEIIFEKIDPILAAANANNYATYEMIAWKEEMLSMPGKWTDTIEDDYYMLAQLSERLNNQKNFKHNLSNNLELLERGMRRRDSLFYKYETAYEQVKHINTGFPFSDTIVIEKIINFIEKDYFFIILLTLSFFSIFSNASQTGVLKQIFISSKGIRRYSFSQCSSVLLLTLLYTVIYYLSVVVILSNGNFDYLLWEMPIQAINGYENITFALSFTGYLVNSIIIKLLHSLAISLLVLLVSILSRNNITSAVICLLLCCGIIVPTSAIENGTLLNTILIGGSKFLFSDLPYTKLFGYVIPYKLLFIIAEITVIMFIFGLIVFLSKYVAKRQVK